MYFLTILSVVTLPGGHVKWRQRG